MASHGPTGPVASRDADSSSRTTKKGRGSWWAAGGRGSKTRDVRTSAPTPQAGKSATQPKPLPTPPKPDLAPEKTHPPPIRGSTRPPRSAGRRKRGQHQQHQQHQQQQQQHPQLQPQSRRDAPASAPPHRSAPAQLVSFGMRHEIDNLVNHTRAIAMDHHRPTTPGSHIDWAQDDDDDSLPDLDDWGITASGSTNASLAGPTGEEISPIIVDGLKPLPDPAAVPRALSPLMTSFVVPVNMTMPVVVLDAPPSKPNGVLPPPILMLSVDPTGPSTDLSATAEPPNTSSADPERPRPTDEGSTSAGDSPEPGSAGLAQAPSHNRGTPDPTEAAVDSQTNDATKAWLDLDSLPGLEASVHAPKNMRSSPSESLSSPVSASEPHSAPASAPGRPHSRTPRGGGFPPRGGRAHHGSLRPHPRSGPDTLSPPPRAQQQQRRNSHARSSSSSPPSTAAPAQDIGGGRTHSAPPPASASASSTTTARGGRAPHAKRPVISGDAILKLAQTINSATLAPVAKQ